LSFRSLALLSLLTLVACGGSSSSSKDAAADRSASGGRSGAGTGGATGSTGGGSGSGGVTAGADAGLADLPAADAASSGGAAGGTAGGAAGGAVGSGGATEGGAGNGSGGASGAAGSVGPGGGSSGGSAGASVGGAPAAGGAGGRAFGTGGAGGAGQCFPACLDSLVQPCQTTGTCTYAVSLSPIGANFCFGNGVKAQNVSGVPLTTSTVRTADGSVCYTLETSIGNAGTSYAWKNPAGSTVATATVASATSNMMTVMCEGMTHEVALNSAACEGQSAQPSITNCTVGTCTF